MANDVICCCGSWRGAMGFGVADWANTAPVRAIQSISFHDGSHQVLIGEVLIVQFEVFSDGKQQVAGRQDSDMRVLLFLGDSPRPKRFAHVIAAASNDVGGEIVGVCCVLFGV